MNPGDLSFLQIGIWIIPLVLLGSVLLLLFLLVRSWQKNAQEDLKQTRSELRRLHSLRRELEQAGQGYAPADPEPYGPLAVELHDRIAQFDEQLHNLERTQVSIQESIRPRTPNRWQAIITAPYGWYGIRRQIAAQKKNLAGLQTLQDAAQQTLKKLAGLPWEVAQQARQVKDLQQQLSDKIEMLRGNKVHGDSLDALLHEQNDLQATLGQIPGYFYRAEQRTVLAQADAQVTAQAYAVLKESQPKLEKMLATTGQWQAQYTETTSKVVRMRQHLDRLDPLLSNQPDGLELKPLQTQVGQLNVIAQNLQATLARLEVESMQIVAEEAAKVQQAASDINHQLKSAHQQHKALNQVLTELTGGLGQLSDQFARLGTSPVHPLAWSASRATLTEISQKASALGPAQKPRQPQQVEQDLAAANQLNARQKELATHCQQLAGQHAELLKLLESPDLEQGQAWVQTTQTLLGRIKAYDPDNWARADSVATLPDELRSLSQGLRKLVGDPTASIPEAELGLRLDETRRLSSRVQELRARVGNVQNRLEQIQQIEQTAGQNLESARAALAQIGLLARSNTFLSGMANQEIARSQRQIDQQTAEMAQRERGLLDKKSRAVSALLDRITQNGNLWVVRISKEIESQKLALTEKLNALQAIADLEDPVIAEVQRQLASIGQSPAPGQEYRLDQLLLMLKQRSDRWQSCMAATHALEDVEAPVLDSYNEAAQYRQYARELFENIPSAMREQRSWPPTSLSINSELSEFEQIETQWNGLRGQKVKAITLVAQLGSLSARYQTVAEKTRQIAERIVQEQERVEALEAELDRLTQLWQVQWQAYQSNQPAAEEIRKLLDQLDNDRELLIRQCRQGTRNYQQAIQALEALQRRTRMAQIPIDPNHVIDISGRVIQYR